MLRVGPTGIAYGLDMTDGMLALAQQHAGDAGVANVHTEIARVLKPGGRIGIGDVGCC